MREGGGERKGGKKGREVERGGGKEGRREGGEEWKERRIEKKRVVNCKVETGSSL